MGEVVPGEHVAAVNGIEQAAAGKPAQHQVADSLADGGDTLRFQCRGLEKLRGRPKEREALDFIDAVADTEGWDA